MTDLPLEISVTDAAAALQGVELRPLLLDCRTPEEHATAKIAGALLMIAAVVLLSVAPSWGRRRQAVLAAAAEEPS